MKNIHWYILALAILSGFAGEVWPASFAWGVTLSIWAVRAYVIVQSHRISERIGKRWAYGTTLLVAALSIWYVMALANAGIVSQDQARALHILNIFLVILEVYVGILQSPHPDSVELAEARERLATLQDEREHLAQEVRAQGGMIAEHEENIEHYSEIVAGQDKKINELREALAAEQAAAAKLGKELARLQGMGCIGAKLNGRWVAFEAGQYASGKRFEDCVTLADSEKQLRTRTGYSNGQLKIVAK
jgi:uncharacterized coiled-coil protein SlyX